MSTARFIGIVWLCFIAYWWISAIGVKRNVSRNTGRWAAAYRAATLIIFFVLLQMRGLRIFMERYNPIPAIPAVHIAGVVVCLLGLGFAIWARRYLGRNWGMPMSLKEEPELVTTGPYAIVRHPIYTGLIAAVIGSILAGAVFWMILFVLWCPLFLTAARVEDRLMLEQFPNDYPAYQSRTRFLIPFVF